MTNDEHQSRLCVIHRNMLQRCTNPKNPRFHSYGGRGIAVAPEWVDYQVFKNWAYSSGYSENLTLDRRDNDLGYYAGNCRWATYTTQARNKGKKKLVNATSKYMGVTWRQRNKKWVSSIYVEGKNVYLGIFVSEEDAARARDTYIIENKLEGFVPNFK